MRLIKPYEPLLCDEVTAFSLIELNNNIPEMLKSMGATVADLQLKSSDAGEDEAKGYTISGSTAIVPIKGTLVNANIPQEWATFFGVTAYPRLQETFVELMNNENVEAVILDVDSGGGSAAGIVETNDLLTELRSVKPVRTYANTMCSGAYWLGSNADSVTMSATGVAGSIGVIGAHLSYKDAYEKEGIKPTVIRVGEFKALGHPLEELTSEAKAEIERGMRFTYDIFTETIANQRKVNVSYVKTGMGEGKVFYGAEAVDMNLADSIGKFNDVRFQRTQQSTQTVEHTAVNGDESMNLEQALADNAALTEQVAALKAGEAELSAQVTTLQASVAQLETEKSRLNTQISAMTDSVEAGKAAEVALSTQLENSIKTMAVALNAEAIVPETLEGKQALHTQLSEKFSAKFPAGGVTGVNLTTTETEVSASLPWLKDVVKN